MKTAEQLKRDMGAAAVGDMDDTEPMLLRGRSAATGEPCSVEITPQDVHAALQPYINRILDAMRNALRNVPPELAGDIRENGIHLSGGGAQMPGLAQRISDETGVTVHVSAHPMDDVVLGVGGVITDDELRDALAFASSLDEAG